jgi:hypothetical protein
MKTTTIRNKAYFCTGNTFVLIVAENKKTTIRCGFF